MDEEKDDAQQETNTSHDNIGNAKEWISATQQTCCGYDNTLRSFEFLHLKCLLIKSTHNKVYFTCYLK